MTLSAVALNEKQIVTPAVEVAAGELTPEQAYRQYAGLPCGCPHCLNNALESGIIGFSSGQIIDPLSVVDLGEFQEYIKFVQKHGREAAAVEASYNPDSVFAKVSNRFKENQIDTDLRSLLDGPHPIDRIQEDKRFVVKYWRESRTREGNIKTFMHFNHERGANKFFGCHDPQEITHWVACEVLKREFKKYKFRAPEYSVEREFRFTVSSGNTYVADVAILKDSELIKVYEVQRSYRGLKELQKKTQDIAQDFPIEWIIFSGAYRKMQEQRLWLSEFGAPYKKLFFDNYRIIIEDGVPPKKLDEASWSSRKSKPSEESTCFNQENLGDSEEVETLLPNQVSGIEFRSNIEADRQEHRDDSSVTNHQQSEEIFRGHRSISDIDIELDPVKRAKRYSLVQGLAPQIGEGIDEYEKFITGRDVYSPQGRGVITAVDFIFKKVCVRRNGTSVWLPFEQFSIYS